MTPEIWIFITGAVLFAGLCVWSYRSNNAGKAAWLKERDERRERLEYEYQDEIVEWQVTIDRIDDFFHRSIMSNSHHALAFVSDKGPEIVEKPHPKAIIHADNTRDLKEGQANGLGRLLGKICFIEDMNYKNARGVINFIEWNPEIIYFGLPNAHISLADFVALYEEMYPNGSRAKMFTFTKQLRKPGKPTRSAELEHLLDYPAYYPY